MDKVAWLVAGNKGGVGKSVVAKSMADWLRFHTVAMTIVDGDKRTPDLYAAFHGTTRGHQFDLNEETGWAELSDFLCDDKLQGHIVINLPDGISDRAIQNFHRLERLAASYGFAVKVLFVLNTLPDGLNLLMSLAESFASVIPVKNLFFGSASEFRHFDECFAGQFDDKTILFPSMHAGLMMVYRESHLTLSEFIEQTDDAASNFTYAKIAIADWRDSMFEALEDALQGE